MNKTIKCMVLGSTFYNVVIFVISLLIFITYAITKKLDSPVTFVLKNEMGLILGYIWSIIHINLMARALEKSIGSGDEKYAKGHMVLMSILRLVIFCVILAVIISPKALGLAAGIMFALATLGIKIGTYLVPLIENKFYKEG